MSGGRACHCGEHKEPLDLVTDESPPGARVPRLWRVLDYKCNHSAFSGYQETPSRYSAIMCLRCGARWRTAASYVDRLLEIDSTEENWSVGHAGHAAAMKVLGRAPHPNHPARLG